MCASSSSRSLILNRTGELHCFPSERVRASPQPSDAVALRTARHRAGEGEGGHDEHDRDYRARVEGALPTVLHADDSGGEGFPLLWSEGEDIKLHGFMKDKIG